MRPLYQRRVRQWGAAVLLAAVVPLLIIGAARQMEARARQARADRDLFRALKQTELLTFEGRQSAVQYALARGADPNARMPSPVPPPSAWQSIQALFARIRRRQPPPRPERRVTALTYAAFNGDPALLKALLDKGAAVDARSDDLTPVPCDAVNGPNRVGSPPGPATPVPCSEELLSDKGGDGADVLPGPQRDARPGGVTALMVAAGPDCGGFDVTSTQVLLDRGADVNARDDEGDTALMNAATAPDYYDGTDAPAYTNVPTLRLLLDRGADVNARDRWGQTALILAVEAQSPEDVRLLLARGADATLKDANGETAYAHAAHRGPSDDTRVLRQRGVTR